MTQYTSNTHHTQYQGQLKDHRYSAPSAPCDSIPSFSNSFQHEFRMSRDNKYTHYQNKTYQDIRNMHHRRVLQASDLYESPEHTRPLPHSRAYMEIGDGDLDLSFNSSSSAGSSGRSAARRQPTMGRYAKTYHSQPLYSKPTVNSLYDHQSPGAEDYKHAAKSRTQPDFCTFYPAYQKIAPEEDPFTRFPQKPLAGIEQQMNLNSSYPFLQKRSSSKHRNAIYASQNYLDYDGNFAPIPDWKNNDNQTSHDQSLHYSYGRSMSEDQSLHRLTLHQGTNSNIQHSDDIMSTQTTTPTGASFSSSGYESSHNGEQNLTPQLRGNLKPVQSTHTSTSTATHGIEEAPTHVSKAVVSHMFINCHCPSLFPCYATDCREVAISAYLWKIL